MIEITKKRNIFLLWIEWHLIDAPLFLLKVWKNILLFNLQFFSIFFLLRTLFSYWHKYRWRNEGGFDLRRYLEALFSNLISRLLGSIMRASLILVGILIELVIIIVGAIVIVLWIILPLITLLLFIISFVLIF